MGALDDPIFDPWSSGYPEEPAPSEAAQPSAGAPAAEEAAGPDPMRRIAALEPTLLLADEDRGDARAPASQTQTQPPDPRRSLRRLVRARLEALARRLRLARHEATLEDLLDGSAQLIRFELRPWRSPLSPARQTRPPVLEIGLDAASGDQVTAWYWLDDVGEAPYKTVTVPGNKLTAAWIDRAALDFVAKALERG